MTLASTVTTLPSWPIICLSTAEETTTTDAFEGKNVVIDFWTTKCTRCPAALDKLQILSMNFSCSAATSITFVSICCDSLDGAREIIERDDELKWQGINHYFMATEHKEEAKQIFGFNSVPFYVFVDQQGQITQSGGPSNINWDALPGVQQLDKENETYNANVQREEEHLMLKPVAKVDFLEPPEQPFVIDDLDF